MNRIGVWGDSITWGACDQEMGGWVARLRHYFDNHHQGEPSVYNVGISGDRVGDVLRRFDIEFQAREPDVVILAIGINDSPHDTHPKGTSLGAFEADFRALISKARAGADTVIIVSPTNVDANHPDKHGYSDDDIKPYAAVVEKVAKENDLAFVNVFGLMTKEDLQLDGLHPLDDGHEKIYRLVKDALRVSV